MDVVRIMKRYNDCEDMKMWEKRGKQNEEGGAMTVDLYCRSLRGIS